MRKFPRSNTSLEQLFILTRGFSWHYTCKWYLGIAIHRPPLIWIYKNTFIYCTWEFPRFQQNSINYYSSWMPDLTWTLVLFFSLNHAKYANFVHFMGLSNLPNKGIVSVCSSHEHYVICIIKLPFSFIQDLMNW